MRKYFSLLPSALLVVVALFLFTNCKLSNYNGLFEKASKIESILKTNSDCDEVSLLNYSVTNGVIEASYKLVGCEFETLDGEALKHMRVLKDSISEFCDINKFNLVFVNKGNQTVRSYKKCVLKES